MKPDTPAYSSKTHLDKVVAFLTIIISSIVMLGWTFDIPILRTLSPNPASMKLNAAICFLSGGLALLFIRNKKLTYFFAFFPIFIGLISLLQYSFDWNAGIDEFFLKDPSQKYTSHPGRMAILTAINFILFGFALPIRFQHPRKSEILTSIGLCIATFMLLGYVLNYTAMLGPWQTTHMAFITAITFIIWSIGILLACPDKGFMSFLTNNTSTSYFTRRLILLAFLIPFVLGSLTHIGLKMELYNPTIAILIVIVGTSLSFLILVFNFSIRSHHIEEQLQSELRSSEYRLKNFLLSSLDSFIAMDHKGYVVEFNPASEKLFGYTQNEAIGQKLSDLIIPNELRHRHAEGLSRYLANGYGPILNKRIELEAIDKNNNRFPVELTVTRVNNIEPPLFTGFIRDIKERKLTANLIAMRERQQSAVARVGQAALAGCELDNLFNLVVNTVAETLDVEYCKVLKLLPNSKEVLLVSGVGWKKGLVGTATVSTDRFSQAGYTLFSSKPVIVSDLREEKRFSGPSLLTDHDVISGISCVIGDNKNRPFGVLGTHSIHPRDFTQDDANFLQNMANILLNAIERKRIEQALSEWNLTLENRVKERTLIAENRAHKLRELATQLTQAEQKERQRIAQVLHDHLQQILVAIKITISQIKKKQNKEDNTLRIQSVSDLVDNAITASRTLTAELSPPIMNDANLTALIHWLARWYKEKHTLEVFVEIEEEQSMPSMETKTIAFQSIRELLLNVVKHAQTNKVWIKMNNDPTHYKITIIDKGCGFEFNSLEEDFFQGFGLFQIRERLDLIGGSFKISSQKNAGSTFVVEIPLISSKTKTTPPLDKSSQKPIPNAVMTQALPIQILLADDHNIARQGIKNIFDDPRFFKIVAEAKNGQEAVKLASTHKPHIILMDINMPHLNGIEATRSIKNKFPEIKIIGLSMHSKEDMEPLILEAGGSAYLTKDTPNEKIIETVMSFFEQQSKSL